MHDFFFIFSPHFFFADLSVFVLTHEFSCFWSLYSFSKPAGWGRGEGESNYVDTWLLAGVHHHTGKLIFKSIIHHCCSLKLVQLSVYP